MSLLGYNLFLKAVLDRLSHIDFGEGQTTLLSKTSAPLVQRTKVMFPRNFEVLVPICVMVCLTIPFKYEIFTLELVE